MKTADELREMYPNLDDWKHLKLWLWASRYEDKAQEWNNILPPVTDDRRVYINTYTQVYEALDSLPDNPHNWVCVAVNEKVRKERVMMSKILAQFAD